MIIKSVMIPHAPLVEEQFGFLCIPVAWHTQRRRCIEVVLNLLVGSARLDILEEAILLVAETRVALLLNIDYIVPVAIERCGGSAKHVHHLRHLVVLGTKKSGGKCKECKSQRPAYVRAKR